jgi:hypothetical protein
MLGAQKNPRVHLAHGDSQRILGSLYGVKSGSLCGQNRSLWGNAHNWFSPDPFFLTTTSGVAAVIAYLATITLVK